MAGLRKDDVVHAISSEITWLEETSRLIEDRIEAEVNYRLRESLGRIVQNLQAAS